LFFINYHREISLPRWPVSWNGLRTFYTRTDRAQMQYFFKIDVRLRSQKFSVSLIVRDPFGGRDEERANE
ncbi:MAG: hypothetical protein MUC76_09910, partial [Spirochaetes bacterium]|nr:hypothetical protein [Spirochaetota bacterium]